MFLNLCFLSSPCNYEYNGTNIVQIGPVVYEKMIKMCENAAKKRLTATDFREFPTSNPTQPNLIRSQVGQPRGLRKSFGQFAWFFPISTASGLSNWKTANFEQLLWTCLLS